MTKQKKSKRRFVLTQLRVLLLTRFYVTGSFIYKTTIVPRSEDVESCKITAWVEVELLIFSVCFAHSFPAVTSHLSVQLRRGKQTRCCSVSLGFTAYRLHHVSGNKKKVIQGDACIEVVHYNTVIVGWTTGQEMEVYLQWNGLFISWSTERGLVSCQSSTQYLLSVLEKRSKVVLFCFYFFIFFGKMERQSSREMDLRKQCVIFWTQSSPSLYSPKLQCEWKPKKRQKTLVKDHVEVV